MVCSAEVLLNLHVNRYSNDMLGYPLKFVAEPVVAMLTLYGFNPDNPGELQG